MSVPALDHLERGAHATDGRRAVDWSLGFSIGTQNLLSCRVLANLVLADAHSDLVFEVDRDPSTRASGRQQGVLELLSWAEQPLVLRDAPEPTAT